MCSRSARWASWLLLLILVVACAKVPITGRSQLNLIPASMLYPMSFEQYDAFLAEHPVSDDAGRVAMVERVGQRLQHAVERFYAERGQRGALRNYAWEFHLVENEQVNAWCMPGGKVVVYTGLLPVAEGEAGLAVVMGHEIAHAIAEHGNERMSQALLTQLGGVALSKALEEKPQETRALFLGAYGVGTQVAVLLPYSRLHESEADHLGMIFMALAGYDPHEAVAFWQRMTAAKSGPAPPEFLSTHPSDQARIENLRELIPEAMDYYRQR